MGNIKSRDDRYDSEFRVLRAVGERPDFTQREIARSAGISLGAINYCLKGLIAKGHVKIENFQKSGNKKNYIYVLTPEGLAIRAAMAANFLRRRVAEYESLKAEIEALEQEEAIFHHSRPASERLQSDN